MIKIVCVGGEPCVDVINKCIQSIVNQTHKEWIMQIVLDPADYKIYETDMRISVHINKEPKDGTENSIKAVSLLNWEDEDILVQMDADDWLREDALELVHKAYDGTDILVTHGSWESFPSGWGDKVGHGTNAAYTREEFKNLRKSKWRGSALRTMKYKVYKNIDDNEHRDDNGKYFSWGRDLSTMWPAMEMAGFDRVKHINEPIYIYNVSGIRTPQTHGNIMKEQHHLISDRKPYRRML